MRTRGFDPADAATLGWAIDVLLLGEFARGAIHRRFIEQETWEAADASRVTMLLTWRIAMRARDALAIAPADGALGNAWAATARLADAMRPIWHREGTLQELLVAGRFDEARAVYAADPYEIDISPEYESLAGALGELAREAPEAWAALDLRQDVMDLLSGWIDLPMTGDGFAA